MEFHLRFGMHRDIPLIHEMQNCIDGNVIPGHILAHQAPSTSVFVTSMPTKRYIIDPMTFIFQSKVGDHKSETTGDLRPSVEKMCEAYHPGLCKMLREIPDDMQPTVSDFPATQELCEGSYRFQTEFVRANSKGSKTSKYRKRYDKTEHTDPGFIVPPYFHFTSTDDEFYTMSLDCAHHTQAMSDVLPVVPIICFNAERINDSMIATLLADYSDFDRVIFWIDNFNQTFARVEQIDNVRNLISEFSKAGKMLETLYGGYLFIMMQKDGLSGVSCGILYTQHKSTTLAPGSGGAPERYYIPQFHDFRSLSQTDIILHRHPELMCTCAVCKEVLAGNPDKFIHFSDNPELLRKHFLTVRRQECEEIESMDLGDIVERFRDTHRQYHKLIASLPNPDAFIGDARMQGLDYLLRWSDAFEEV